MPKLIVVARDGREHHIEASAGISVMEAIREDGFDELLALCGGCCSCATCHVYVASDTAANCAPMTDDEHDLLDSSDHRQPQSRLSCQLILTDDTSDIRVTIAPED